MRDTAELHQRLRALVLPMAGLVSAGTTACDDASQRSAAPRAATTAADDPAETEAPPSSARAQAAAPQPEDEPRGAAARFAPIPGDPPYVDGYNPEEEHCPSGNWCGPVEAAKPLAVQTTTAVMGCPARISGAVEPGSIEGPVYRGLSASPAMLGAFNQGKTERTRAEGTDDVCCYHWFEYCSGRPLLEEGEARTAPTMAGASSWSLPSAPPPAELDPWQRAVLAQGWLEDARAEHASIASFARATLELMALAAPPHLLAGYQQAALDEIEHARHCFALVERYTGQPMAPLGLPPASPRPLNMADCAVRTFVEGCVGETVAALCAVRAEARCRDPRVCATLDRIATDETRHAALAWSTVSWAIQAGGAPVARAVERALTAMAARFEAEMPARPAPAPSDLASHGRLSSAETQAARQAAFTDIIAPMVRELLATPAHATTSSA